MGAADPVMYLCVGCSWNGDTPAGEPVSEQPKRSFPRYPRPGPSQRPVQQSRRAMLERMEAAAENVEPSPLEIHNARVDLERLAAELREGR